MVGMQAAAFQIKDEAKMQGLEGLLKDVDHPCSQQQIHADQVHVVLQVFVL